MRRGVGSGVGSIVTGIVGEGVRGGVGPGVEGVVGVGVAAGVGTGSVGANVGMNETGFSTHSQQHSS